MDEMSKAIEEAISVMKGATESIDRVTAYCQMILQNYEGGGECVVASEVLRLLGGAK